MLHQKEVNMVRPAHLTSSFPPIKPSQKKSTLPSSHKMFRMLRELFYAATVTVLVTRFIVPVPGIFTVTMLFISAIMLGYPVRTKLNEESTKINSSTYYHHSTKAKH